MSADDEVLFPYMEFARTEAFRSPFSLTQSGMPTANAEVFGDQPVDLAWAGADALPRLQERIARHLGSSPERVFVTVGASSAMQILALAFFQPGVRVVSERPSYEPIRNLPRRLGAECTIVDRRPETGWSFEPEEVARNLRGTRGAGHVFFSNPNNPTGAISSAAEVRALARAAADHGGLLIACEVYMEFARDDSERVHAFRLAPNAISIGSLTKAFGLGALRIGWIALSEELARERVRVRDMLYLNFVDAPTPALRLGALAFDRLSELALPIARMEQEQKPILVRWLSQTPGVSGTAPRLGLTSFPSLVGIEDTRAFARHLVSEHGVDVVPGEFFGRAGHIRIGCGLAPEALTEALARVARGSASFATWRSSSTRA